jgi:DNA relaxase NicK
MVNLNERGSTIYIGSPKSRCRMRIYNKSAELGEDRIDGQEKLRVELQCRDEYGDRAMINMLSGTGDAFFRYYVLKMSDAYVTSIVDRAMANSNLLAMTEVNSLKSEDSRKEWLEHSVMPALTKLSVYDPSYFREFLDRLKSLID